MSFDVGRTSEMDTLSSRLARARRSRDLSQPQLAKLAGVSQGTIGNIEAGIRGGASSLAAIAHALQISYWWLRDGTGEMDLSTHPWPFSSELWEAVKDLDGTSIRRCENAIRATLDMPSIRPPVASAHAGDSEKQHPQAA